MRLFRAASVEQQWRGVVAPWLRGPAAEAWKHARPTILLAPTRAEGFYLRGRLVEEGGGYLGVRFWTPSDARLFLRSQLVSPPAATTLADLRLVARLTADRLAAAVGSESSASVRSAARDPAAFLRAYELLVSGGWDPAVDGSSYALGLAKAFQGFLRENDLATQAELHQILARAARNDTARPIANLLLVGFNAAHWPLWDLLKAAAFRSEQAVISLMEPRTFGEAADQLWFNSWEEICGVTAEVPSSFDGGASTPLAGLVATYEGGTAEKEVVADCTFCVTPDVTSHVRAVVLHALDFLRRENCTRLGIVFAEANALALGVASALRGLEIPLNDGPGVLVPGPFERRHWLAWVALQEEPGVERLIEWLRASEAAEASTGAESGLSAGEIAEAASGALNETLVDDLGYLAAHLQARHPGRRRAIAGEFLRARVALPDQATFADFLSLTRSALGLPGWEDQMERLEQDPPAWLRRRREPLSRCIFLGWLRESTASHARARGRDGNHYYGRVHLLVYGQATGQSWSHLILTGLNEGVWPRTHTEAAFASRHELAALNQAARALNRRAAAQGSQGEGQDVVRDSFGHCLLPLERQDLALRDVAALVESTQEAVCLTAVSTEAGRALLPSDFFNHAYQMVTGQALDEESFRHLAHRTMAWCERHRPLFEATEGGHAGNVELTRTAYQARRDPSQPFGRYEYAFAQPPGEPIQLACKEWEAAWRHPSHLWMMEIVGAAPWPDGTMAWNIATGTWAHRWLAAALGDCQRNQRPDGLIEYVLAAAKRERDRTLEGARAASVALYPWWGQVWSQARTGAVILAERVLPHLAGHQAWAEHRLAERISIALPGAARADFDLSGRLDLLLIESAAYGRDPTGSDLTGFACWIIDFKTGAAGALSDKSLAKGIGLQALLYGLAIKELGAGSTGVSIFSRKAPARVQVKLTGGNQFESLLRSLDRLHRDGIFGRRPGADSAYGFAPADPMATQSIPDDVLSAKWALVHDVPVEGDGETK